MRKERITPALTLRGGNLQMDRHFATIMQPSQKEKRTRISGEEGGGGEGKTKTGMHP